VPRLLIENENAFPSAIESGRLKSLIRVRDPQRAEVSDERCTCRLDAPLSWSEMDRRHLPASRARRPVTAALIAAAMSLLCVASGTGAAAAPMPSHQPAVAPPATPAVAAACARQVAVAAATADEVSHVPHGRLELSGCVSDTSGIEHVVVRWNRGDDHGRICTDPVVNGGEWRCPWDTTRLPSGAYELELIAVDAAGNRGSSTRPYEIDDRRLAPQEPAQAPAPAPTQPLTPPTDAPPAAPPAITTPTPPASTPAPAAAPTAPEQPAEPQFSAVQQMVIDRLAACDNGGVDEHPTDDPAVTTQFEQVQSVLDCLDPALRLAGADATHVRDESPLPLAVVVEVADATARADLDAALPDTIAGVPVLVVEPNP
jgi:hypothetical protein